MHEFVVVTFPDAAMTGQGIDAIRSLHREGGIKIYGAVVVARGTRGKLRIQEVIKRGHGATAAGALIGALGSSPFGPIAMLIGTIGGAVIGYSAELLHEGDTAEVVKKTSRDLAGDRTAMVAEIAEDGSTEFAAIMARIGGTVLRKE